MGRQAFVPHFVQSRHSFLVHQFFRRPSWMHSNIHEDLLRLSLGLCKDAEYQIGLTPPTLRL
jgi:hypothetical protein